MVAKLRLWWQKVSRPLDTVIIIFLAILVALMVTSIVGYIFNWGWIGLGPYTSPPHPKDSDYQRGKTLWDWLQLLIIPAVIAIGGYLFSLTTSRNEQKAVDQHNQTERDIALDNQREVALQGYIDKMSELLLEKHLRESGQDEARKIARVRTLTVLPRLDVSRKRSVLEFLYEAGLIVKDQPIIDLCWADFRGVNLRGSNLHKADLSGANLREATLWKADLSEADLGVSDLRKADLREADLSRADLSNSDLREAYLNGADIHEGDLCGAKLNDAKLNRVHLNNADLSFARMVRANLQGAWLDEANLEGTNLENADLRDADLREADLSKAFLEGANLEGAKVTQQQLDKASSLKDATMPDGSKHP